MWDAPRSRARGHNRGVSAGHRGRVAVLRAGFCCRYMEVPTDTRIENTGADGRPYVLLQAV